MPDWVDACGADEVEPEDLIPFVHGGRRYVIVRDAAGAFFCLDGICSHETSPLHRGLVQGSILECPRHNGRFDCRTGAALRAPATIPLATYEVAVADGRVRVRVG